MANRVKARLCLGPDAEHVYRALLAEVSQPAPEKGRVSVRLEDECVVLEVESGSLSGLRALTNSFLLLAYASYSSLRRIEAQDVLIPGNATEPSRRNG